jgi:hypothetical protein
MVVLVAVLVVVLVVMFVLAALVMFVLAARIMMLMCHSFLFLFFFLSAKVLQNFCNWVANAYECRFFATGLRKNVTFAALIVGGVNIFLYLCRAVNEKLL